MSKALYYLPAILAALLSSDGQVIPYGEQHTGTATYYDADGSGSCLFDASTETQYVAALNSSDYDSPVIKGQSYANATLCGAYVQVTGKNGSVVVKIVNRCAASSVCTANHFDLSSAAFATIDDLNAGYVDISWQLVSAPVDGPIKFRYKSGSSQWWTAVQVSNHRNPVARVEVLQDSTWQELPRTDYNYFIDDNGFGPGCQTLRVTDIFGNQLTETSTVCFANSTLEQTDWSGTGQFPAP